MAELYLNGPPLVSIVVATYNGDLFLSEQLESIKNQIYENFEIIISDDASTDSTFEIINSFVKNNPDLIIKLNFNKKNLGYVKNFEKAISLSNGNYIALCDQDDIWMPEKLSKCIDNLENTKALAIFTNAKIINDKGDYTNDTLFSLVKFEPEIDHISPSFFYLQNCATGCTMVINRALLETAIPFPESLPHDWWLAYQASFLNSLIYTDDYLIKYRLHNNNTIGIPSINKKNKPLTYFFKKLDPRLKLKSKVVDAIKIYVRFSHMMKFEILQKGRPSIELNYLRQWVSYTYDNNRIFEVPKEILNNNKYRNTHFNKAPKKFHKLKSRIYFLYFLHYAVISVAIIFLGKLF